MESVLQIKKNSYATIEEADTYVKTNFQPYDPLRVIWSVLSIDEKDIYMLKSMSELEVLPVRGRKYDYTQSLQFPRLFEGGYPFLYHPLRVVNYYEVPEEVKMAQIENALGLIEKECSEQASKQFAVMQTLGAVKNLKYNKRDMSDAMISGVVTAPTQSKNKLTSEKAILLLRSWLM